MDIKYFLFIIFCIVALGIIYMVFMNKRGKASTGVAQDAMKEFVREQLPTNTNVKVINLLEDAVNAQHIWVVAYNDGGLNLIPTISNPITQTLKRYEDLTPMYNVHKWIAANVMTGNKSEDVDYVPYSAISGVSIDESKKKIQITIGDTVLKFKYQNKDMFGAFQEKELDDFFSYLNKAKQEKAFN